MITAISNEKIKQLKKLHSAKYRKINRQYLVHGEHLVNEALKKAVLSEVITTNDSLNYPVPVTYVNNQVLRHLSELVNPAPIIGVVTIPKPKPIIGNVLVLDGVQDPGNLGTILRSANAFNINNILLGLNTVDLYNDKVIRGAQGQHYHLNIIKTDIVNEISDLKQKGYTIYGTDVNNGTNLSNIMVKSPYVLIMGSEGQGMSPKLKEMCDELINIETAETCESLNVAMATSIILYHFR